MLQAFKCVKNTREKRDIIFNRSIMSDVSLTLRIWKKEEKTKKTFYIMTSLSLNMGYLFTLSLSCFS